MSPSLISLMVSVDVKHHVYLVAHIKPSTTTRGYIKQCFLVQLSEFGTHPPLLWPRKRLLPASGLLMCALTFVQGQFCLLSGKEQENLPSKL